MDESVVFLCSVRSMQTNICLLLISLTECNSDTTQKFPILVNTTIELRVITTTNNNSKIQLS